MKNGDIFMPKMGYRFIGQQYRPPLPLFPHNSLAGAALAPLELLFPPPLAAFVLPVLSAVLSLLRRVLAWVCSDVCKSAEVGLPFLRPAGGSRAVAAGASPPKAISNATHDSRHALGCVVWRRIIWGKGSLRVWGWEWGVWLGNGVPLVFPLGLFLLFSIRNNTVPG